MERIVVRVPNWLGDVVLCLGALRDLRRRNFPEAHLAVLARPSVAELLQAVPEVDAVHASRGMRADAETVRGAFDAAVLFTNSFGTALVPWLAAVPQRWGYATDGRGPLLTRAGRVPEGTAGVSEAYYHRAMLAAVGLEVSATPDTSLTCPPAWAEQADVLLGGGSWIGVNPGAAFGTAKRWFPERYAAVAERLAREAGASVVILGGPSERPLAQAIAALLHVPVRVLAGETTIGSLVGVLSRLRLLLTGDSGPMHLAAALGTPLCAVFGPTDWRETAPRGTVQALVRVDVECAPCKLRDCPIDHRCMTRVSPDRVAAEALTLSGDHGHPN